MEGKKNDQGKVRYNLIPPKALKEIATVLTHGAEKYGDNNWKKVDGRRYINACFRHLESFRSSERYDPDSGLHHIAHAITSLLFILEKELTNLTVTTFYEDQD